MLSSSLSINAEGGLLAERIRIEFWFIPSDKHFCKRHARQGGNDAEKYRRVSSMLHFPF